MQSSVERAGAASAPWLHRTITADSYASARLRQTTWERRNAGNELEDATASTSLSTRLRPQRRPEKPSEAPRTFRRVSARDRLSLRALLARSPSHRASTARGALPTRCDLPPLSTAACSTSRSEPRAMGRQTGAGAGPAGRAGAGSRGQTFGGRVRFRGRGRGRGGSSSRGRGGKAGANGDAGPSLQTEDGTKDDDRAEDAAARDEIDEKLGFGRISAGPPKVGWLVNMSATTIRDEAFPAGRAGASTRSQRCSSARRRLLLHRGERQHGTATRASRSG